MLMLRCALTRCRNCYLTWLWPLAWRIQRFDRVINDRNRTYIEAKLAAEKWTSLWYEGYSEARLGMFSRVWTPL